MNKTYYPNFTIISLPIFGILFTSFVVSFFGNFFLSIVLKGTLLTENDIVVMVILLIPILLMLYLLVTSVIIFLNTYSIKFKNNEIVVFEHFLKLYRVEVLLAELKLRKKHFTSSWNDPNFNLDLSGIPRSGQNLNWLKERVYLETSNGKNISIYSFGYNDFFKLQKQLMKK